jgi:preprotein translocase subunit SecG
MNKTTNILYIQFLILLGGTIFAWYQWILEYLDRCKVCGTNATFSKCFVGALFFTLALILNIIMIYKSKVKKSE